MDHQVQADTEKIGRLQQQNTANSSLQWSKDFPDNRHVLLRARNDLSSSVAQTVARIHQTKPPTPPPQPTIHEEAPEEPKTQEPVALQVVAPPPMPRAPTQLQTTDPIVTTPVIPPTRPPGANKSSPKNNRKRGIPHVYRDFSNVPDAAGFVRKKTGGVTQPFPEKVRRTVCLQNGKLQRY